MEGNEKIKILILENDVTGSDVLTKILSKVGYEIKAVAFGRESLRKIEDAKPSLIIIYVNLPDITGCDICKQLKSSTITSAVSILEIYSNNAKSEDLVYGIECGADNYLIKPIDSHVLLAIIKSMLKIQGTENRLRTALKKAEASSNVKTQFLANISHELKTPINIIVSALQMTNITIKQINRSPLKEKLNKYNGMIKQNSFRLIKLINNIIDSTKIESGFMSMNRKSVNIVRLVENITLSVASLVESKQIELIFDTEVEEKITACDPDKIETILFNLLSNAVKFTDIGGKITVNMYDRGDYIIISVKDTGVGIAEGNREKVFQRFIQIDETSNRNREGSGIGLSIVKSFVEMHGGSINIKSNEGRGSNFIIKLPIIKMREMGEVDRENDVDYYTDRINVEFSDIDN